MVILHKPRGFLLPFNLFCVFVSISVNFYSLRLICMAKYCKTITENSHEKGFVIY